jgi:hypothetical protein
VPNVLQDTWSSREAAPGAMQLHHVVHWQYGPLQQQQELQCTSLAGQVQQQQLHLLQVQDRC